MEKGLEHGHAPQGVISYFLCFCLSGKSRCPRAKIKNLFRKKKKTHYCVIPTWTITKCQRWHRLGPESSTRESLFYKKNFFFFLVEVNLSNAWHHYSLWLTDFSMHQSHLQGLVNTECWAPSPELLIQEVWAEAQVPRTTLSESLYWVKTLPSETSVNSH